MLQLVRQKLLAHTYCLCCKMKYFLYKLSTFAKLLKTEAKCHFPINAEKSHDTCLNLNRSHAVMQSCVEMRRRRGTINSKSVFVLMPFVQKIIIHIQYLFILLILIIEMNWNE